MGLALARLRARGQLTELRAAELRFTPGEAAVAAGEVTWAARLIEQHFDAVHSLRGEAATVQRWFAPLPADLVWSRPRLLLAQAVPAATGGRLEAAEQLVDAAERAYAGTGEEPFEPTIGPAGSLLVNVPATIALVRGYLAQLRGDARGIFADEGAPMAALLARLIAAQRSGSGFGAVAEVPLGCLARLQRAGRAGCRSGCRAGQRHGGA